MQKLRLCSQNRWKQKNYLIVDDVVTTGATLEYAAQLLKKNGAKDVMVAAIAKQPLDDKPQIWYDTKDIMER